MAGGKETPRQKMIGLVYLALTALLAMNITNTVLDKFVSINKSLERTIAEDRTKNDLTVAAISTAVSESGNRAADVAVLEKSRRVRTETEAVVRELNELKETFITETGGLDENGEVKGKTNTNIVADYMINKGNGEILKERLNNYVDFLRQESGLGERITYFALDGSEDPLYQNDPNQKQKDFAELKFLMTPTVAGIADVSQLTTEVLNREAIVLDELRRSVGASDLRFDNILPMVRADAKYVAAGTKYEAELFLSASLSSVAPEMTINGNPIPVENGVGKIEFTAAGGGYDANDVARRTFTGEIKLPTPGGGDTTFTREYEYFVIKPVVQILSATVSQLYLNAGNELNIQVPALGAAYDPSFTAQGAAIVNGPQRGLVTVVPNSAEVTLNIASGGTPIESRKFQVSRIPLPTLAVGVNGRPANLREGMPAAGVREVAVNAIAEENFKNFLPNDAQYRVVSFKLLLGRGQRILQERVYNSERANVSDFIGQAQPGDRIVIEEVKVQRRNFRGDIENVNMPATFISIPLN